MTCMCNVMFVLHWFDFSPENQSSKMQIFGKMWSWMPHFAHFFRWLVWFISIIKISFKIYWRMHSDELYFTLISRNTYITGCHGEYIENIGEPGFDPSTPREAITPGTLVSGVDRGYNTWLCLYPVWTEAITPGCTCFRYGPRL